MRVVDNNLGGATLVAHIYDFMSAVKTAPPIVMLSEAKHLNVYATRDSSLAYARSE